jgi:Methyl-accepting chemotaxis protein
MLKNLKISHKLIISFFVSFLFLCIVGITGISSVNKVFNNGQTIYDDNLMCIDKLTSLKSNFIEIRANMEAMMNSANKGSIDKYESRITELVTADNQLMKDYEVVIASDQKEQDLYKKDVKSNLDEYRSTRAKVIELSKEGKYDEATRLYNSSYKSITSTVENGIVDIINHNLDSAKLQDNDNDKIHEMSFVLLLVVMVAGALVSSLSAIIIIKGIMKKVNRVVEFSKQLGEGDLTHQMEIMSNDELDVMGKALNKATANVRELISEIMSGMQDVTASSEELTATVEEVTATMINVQNTTHEIAQGNTELSSSTEEVSSSTEEIEALTAELDERAILGAKSSADIMKRAIDVKSKAEKSSQTAYRVYDEKELNIKKAIEGAKIVKEISVMAETIGEIARRTNLLSLNASIESARAGEAGRGFAVVATEIRSLSEQSATTVKEISVIVAKVQEAIDNLVINANDVLSFIDNQVKPDYEMLSETGVQYQKDAEFVNQLSNELAVATTAISESISSVSSAIQNVSATCEQSASSSEEILQSVSQTTVAIEEIAHQAQSTSELAERITSLTQKFKV